MGEKKEKKKKKKSPKRRFLPVSSQLRGGGGKKGRERDAEKYLQPGTQMEKEKGESHLPARNEKKRKNLPPPSGHRLHTVAPVSDDILREKGGGGGCLAGLLGNVCLVQVLLSAEKKRGGNRPEFRSVRCLRSTFALLNNAAAQSSGAFAREEGGGEGKRKGGTFCARMRQFLLGNGCSLLYRWRKKEGKGKRGKGEKKKKNPP